jgi:hypothetical protein
MSRNRPGIYLNEPEQGRRCSTEAGPEPHPTRVETKVIHRTANPDERRVQAMNSSGYGRDVPADSRNETAGRSVSAEAPEEDELVDEMVDESFPGSDPPSTWGGVDEPASS